MLAEFIYLSIILFLIGILGVITNRKNIIILLMSIELMLLSINLLLISTSAIIDNVCGLIFSLYILVVAAAESAIGLSILIAFYRTRGTISVSYANLLKG